MMSLKGETLQTVAAARLFSETFQEGTFDEVEAEFPWTRIPKMRRTWASLSGL